MPAEKLTLKGREKAADVLVKSPDLDCQGACSPGYGKPAFVIGLPLCFG